MTLPAEEVHLWYDILDAAEDAARLTAAREVVTPGEWDRCQRFAFPEGRRECLAARCLVRRVLSSYEPAVSPADWRFNANRWGRPEVAEPESARHLRFNLSHSDGVVACVVSAHYDVGIDVERLGRRTPLQIADAHFAPSEIAALNALPDDEQPRRFLEYWTLKEAYIKARGAGLSLALDRFSFDLAGPADAQIRFAAGFTDDARAWQFDRLLIGIEHLAAVATRKAAAGRIELVARRVSGPGFGPR